MDADIGRQAATRIRLDQWTLAVHAVERQYAAQPQLWGRYGSSGLEASRRDTAATLNYLAAALDALDPGVFRCYAVWLRDLLVSRDLGGELTTHFDVLRNVLGERLPAREAALAGYYLSEAAGALAAPTAPPEPPATGRDPWAELRQNWLDRLLAADRRGALDLVRSAVQGGTSVAELYLQVFQPGLREVGRLWHLSRVTVAHEHYVSAATGWLMGQLQAHAPTEPVHGRRFVGLCVDDELHELGLRMVCDFFDWAGWETHFLGARTPRRSVPPLVEALQPEVVGISCTLPIHVSYCRELVAALRASPAGRQAVVLVGGQALLAHPGLAHQIGADAVGSDAASAVSQAEQLLAARTAA
ncbi:MAG: cobalamin-dependent protein [Fimbriimonadaceae bacterium]|nr:cobalamin-dependent protein [Fimbriimonadaceae bacterium]